MLLLLSKPFYSFLSSASAFLSKAGLTVSLDTSFMFILPTLAEMLIFLEEPSFPHKV